MFKQINTLAQQFRNDTQGVTAIEYALIATFIAVAIIAAASTLGSDIAAQFTSIGLAV